MADKVPQSTAVLVKRLRRVAKFLDTFADDVAEPSYRARANTCWQAAARLEELDANATTIDLRMDPLSWR